jgi:sodium-dependent phosphate transporter
MAPRLPQYTWMLAAITVFFSISCFGNGANDVANSYANSVASRTLTMPQVGVLAMFTEFIGAVALGGRVTNTIKNGILQGSFFEDRPGALMVAMLSAELGSSIWLVVATKAGFPVSTTQTVIGAIIGAGIASGAPVRWGWRKNSFSQIAASWVVSPVIAAIIAATLFASMKFCILERKDPLVKALRALPFYLAFTASILALFLVVECPMFDSLEDLGAGRACAIVLGTLFGTLAISYIFLVPFFKRKVIIKDPKVRWYHIPLGPLLLRDNPPLYWPAPTDRPIIIDYYASAHAVC